MKKEEVELGKTYWYGTWTISWSGCRITKLPRPKRYKITDLMHKNTYYVVGTNLETGKTNEVINPSCLFETLEDLWSSFNSSIYNKMDSITKTYEENIKYLKSKLHG